VPLVRAVQDQQDQIKALQDEIKALKELLKAPAATPSAP
jgi:hypothetical protein